MAKKKLEIKATIEQLNSMYDSLRAGAPLQIALQRANISVATYYYWVAISSIVVAVKTQEEIEEIEELAKSGVSIQEIRELAAAANKGRKSGVGTYIEPSAESILKYKNSKKFQKFADQCHEIIKKCDAIRSEFATLQLLRIASSTQKKNGINPSGAMWWLERNLPDFFAKPSDKVKEQENQDLPPVPAVTVEFVDPETNESSDRLHDMEQKILNDLKGGNEA